MSEFVTKQILEHLDLILQDLDETEQKDLNLSLRLKLLRAGLALTDLGIEEGTTSKQLDLLLPAINTLVEVYKGLLIMVPEAEAQASEKALADLLMRATKMTALA
jgi:hypothetical protein